jgi:DNA-binding SARP family transcriptional activator
MTADGLNPDDLGGQLCLALESVALVDHWLTEFCSRIRSHLGEVDTQLRSALAAVAQDPSIEPEVEFDSPNLHADCPQPPGPAAEKSTHSRQVDFGIRCLGTFAVYHNGHRVPFPRNRKVNAVMRCLVIHWPHPVAREILLGLGWSNATPQAALNGLNTVISILRRHLTAALGHPALGSPIVFADDRYYLNPALGLEIDIAKFEDCYGRGRAYERGGCLTQAMDAYRAAAALYHGDVIMDDPCDAAMIIERERLACIFSILLVKLSEHCLAHGQYEEAIDYSHRLLERDPCHEEAHRLLMRCFSRLGQAGQALRQYELCIGLLRRELDLTPAPETTALQQRIAQGQSV